MPQPNEALEQMLSVQWLVPLLPDHVALEFAANTEGRFKRPS